MDGTHTHSEASRSEPALLGVVAAAAGSLCAAVVAVVLLAIPAAPAAAAPPASPETGPSIQAADDGACLRCHRTPSLDMGLPGGERLALTVEPDAFAASAHGKAAVSCVTCHPGRDSFPHPKVTSGDARQYQLDYYPTCKGCHEKEFGKALDSVHQRALAGGERQAPVCSDCHNPHTQLPIKQQPRAAIATTCSTCHNGIYAQYRDSVHGAALVKDNPDVPSCIDCHGVHNIADPTTNVFRLRSPTEMCGKCHTDPARMDKYGISTQVLNTYVSDFHGTTVALFSKQSPDQPTNKPVCFDCHGVHDIKAVDDPQKGLHVKQNLLDTCQKCHPDATLSFPDSWLNHYVPSPKSATLVFVVDLFYKIFIPTTLGGMGIFVALDVWRRIAGPPRAGGGLS
ncbi:MAG TPA: cytochrome c3 family protein [Chloroflexota bacterium]|nr:cytochrome c3 family protein [Chloroflexota bacterium]